MAASQALGRLFRRFGQPQVIGEMLAGIVLGPSLFGWLAPNLHRSLFPAESFATLGFVGQLGLVFYMFFVGASLDLTHLRDNRKIALVTSMTSIAIPFAAGVSLALMFHSQLAAAGTSRLVFALFLGVCLSITAFPVLARILHEMNLLGTRLGAVAISCAAADDVTAWLMLAVILSLVRASAQSRPLWQTLAELGVYVAVMLLLRKLVGALEWGTRDLPLLLLWAVGSAVATEWIGIHAVFGAFFAGVVAPNRQRLLEWVRETVEPFNTVVLLPLFFALTGLRTQIGLLMNAASLGYAAIILVAAVAGKWLGASLAARWMGLPVREANALGILMNTRGLVELVVLNIGYEAGLIPGRTFSMLVVMALLTTFMTTPLLRRMGLTELAFTEN
jgi:Kef-type K+ transport system membrane component KefB